MPEELELPPPTPLFAVVYSDGSIATVDAQTYLSLLSANLQAIMSVGGVCAQPVESNGPSGGFVASHPDGPGFVLPNGSINARGVSLKDDAGKNIAILNSSVRQFFDKAGGVGIDLSSPKVARLVAVPKLPSYTSLAGTPFSPTVLPEEGMIAWDYANHAMKVYNGTAWV